jgi:hypothetical protein
LPAVDSARRGDDPVAFCRPSDFGCDLFENINVAIQEAIDDVDCRECVPFVGVAWRTCEHEVG